MKKLFLIGCTAVALAGCYNDSYDKLYPTPIKPNACDTTTISYTTDIKPILTQNCNSSDCHGAGGGSGYDFTDSTVLQPLVQNGTVVNDINWTPTGRNHNMPTTGNKLGSCEINKITRWANLGANCGN